MNGGMQSADGAPAPIGPKSGHKPPGKPPADSRPDPGEPYALSTI